MIRLDLEDFFTTVRRRRVHGVFRGAGYPDCVAESLAALCTHALPGWHWARAPRPDLRTPAEDEDHGRAGVLLRSNHLPQGAPTSPALANLACYRLDCRLSRAAAAVGAEYTRYADDLAFSGDESFGARAARFVAFAGGIAMDEGFRVNFRKTRIMRASQRQELAGLVVNRGPNQRRRELERLEATLYNAVRYGPSSQNREQHPDFRAHLQGRISWVRQVSQTRAARLEELFEQIPW